MEPSGVKRRDFMKWSLAAGGALALASALPRHALGAGTLPKALTLEECLHLSPVEIADRSVKVQESWRYIQATVQEIQDAQIRKIVEDILKNPAPTFMERYATKADQLALRQTLLQAGLLDEKVVTETAEFPPKLQDSKMSPQPFYSAPGSGYQSHHSYPGGLATHTALNVKASLSLYEHYDTVYGYRLNKEVVIAAQTLHDLHKPWVFQWQEDGSSRPELQVAGTGEHHIYSIAESMYRGLPPSIVVAQACAHDHPGSDADEKKVVGYIKAAAIIAGKDPVKDGFLAEGGATLPAPRDQEYFVTHLGDHDWVLSVPAAKWVIPVMQQIALKDYQMTEADLKTQKFNAFRNYVFAQMTIMTLHQILNTEGETGVTNAVKALIIA